ncbi:MAG: 3D domain-containing protein [Lachnospiraceae bacterium]|nr:3D domain-containing protein [Lachnospiraceae bacterium]
MDWSSFAEGTYTVTAAAVSGETKTPLIGTITYNKVNVPAPAVAEPVGPASAAASAAEGATGPATGPASGPASASLSQTSGLTPEQIALGPGYLLSLSSNNKESNTNVPYGPGAATYETGEADQYLGSFHATAYCGCERCSGGHSLTYSGTVPQPNHTIAADLDLFPLGTKLMIDGIVYTVEDKGSNVVDQRVDIFFATHEEALAFGLQTVDVYSVK